ncbi:MAG TPA: glycosyltransferase family 2 protein, partial [Dongiaceae bacterium]
GAIDTSTLAEDTYTTFKTQLAGRRVLIDANAIVWAEEPDSVTALWKQRLRWSRGNLQITAAFRHLWFTRGRLDTLGGVPFGLLWFSVALMPLFMILGAVGLVGLCFLWPPWAAKAFTLFWGVTFVIYVFETLFCFAIDPVAGRKCWFEGVFFPGLVSVAMMAVAVSGVKIIGSTDRLSPETWSWGDAAVLLILAWTGISTLAAWLVYRIDRAGAPKWLRNALLVLVGYGPLLCAIAFAAIIAQFRKADLKWDKTIKSGKAKIQT